MKVSALAEWLNDQLDKACPDSLSGFYGTPLTAKWICSDDGIVYSMTDVLTGVSRVAVGTEDVFASHMKAAELAASADFKLRSLREQVHLVGYPGDNHYAVVAATAAFDQLQFELRSAQRCTRDIIVSLCMTMQSQMFGIYDRDQGPFEGLSEEDARSEFEEFCHTAYASHGGIDRDLRSQLLHAYHKCRPMQRRKLGRPARQWGPNKTQ